MKGQVLRVIRDRSSHESQLRAVSGFGRVDLFLNTVLLFGEYFYGK